MKYLLTSDWHLTDKQPQERTGNYPEAQYKKVQWLCKLCAEEKVDAVLHAGDLFDSSKVSHYVVQQYIELLRKFPDFFVTPGQHDLYYHNTNIALSPLMVLHQAGVVQVMQRNYVKEVDSRQKVDFVGWGQEIPDQSDAEILVTHRMVVKEKLWASQTGDTYGGSLLRRYNYKLILSGDNHKNFVLSIGNKRLVNCGSLMRSSIDQADYLPRVYILYTNDTWAIKEFDVPIQPADEVFQLATIKAKKDKDKEIAVFVDGLKNSSMLQALSVEENLLRYKRENKLDKDVLEMLDEVMDGH